MGDAGEVAPLSQLAPPPPASSSPSSFTYFLLLLLAAAAAGYALERRGVPVAARLRGALELLRALLVQLLRLLLARLAPPSPASAAGEEGAALVLQVAAEGSGAVALPGGSGSISSDAQAGSSGGGGGGGGGGAGGGSIGGIGSGGGGSGVDGAPLPPARPLPALTGLPPAADGYRALLSPEDIRQLLPNLPSRCMSKDLHLLFSSQRDGYSLSTLYTKARGSGPTLLVVLDDSQSVFGGFGSRDWSGAEYTAPSAAGGSGGSGAAGLSAYARGSVGYMSSPHRRDLTGGGAHFFGSGDAFLFSLRPDFAVYRWTRGNNEFQLARDDLLAFGGGGGRFGLCLDANLEYGSTGPCETYGNPPLTALGERFRMVRVELYGFREAAAAGAGRGAVTSAALAGAELAKRAISLIQERRSSRVNID